MRLYKNVPGPVLEHRYKIELYREGAEMNQKLKVIGIQTVKLSNVERKGNRIALFTSRTLAHAQVARIVVYVPAGTRLDTIDYVLVLSC